uniref:Uncharacterized protein n=1 Tax=Panagrolaimus davidi TaxID=227884 RepID=A0A914PAT3_9BILA
MSRMGIHFQLYAMPENSKSKDIKKLFGSKHDVPGEGTKCEYKSYFSPPKPSVQCRKGGSCLTGMGGLKKLPSVKHQNISSSECVAFQCGNDERFMSGAGDFEDFEKICTNIPLADMQKIKANKKDGYFYFNETISTLVISCSDADFCTSEKWLHFTKNVPEFESKVLTKWNTKPNTGTCNYESLSIPLPKVVPIPNEKASTKLVTQPQPSEPDEISTSKPEPQPEPEPLKQDENGANGFQLSGMFIFGFILFYL